MRCEECKHTAVLLDENAPCPKCGHYNAFTSDAASTTDDVSVVEDSLDLLVADASVPNLAGLFKAGQAAGLIKPITAYGGPTVT